MVAGTSAIIRLALKNGANETVFRSAPWRVRIIAKNVQYVVIPRRKIAKEKHFVARNVATFCMPTLSARKMRSRDFSPDPTVPDAKTLCGAICQPSFQKSDI